MAFIITGHFILIHSMEKWILTKYYSYSDIVAPQLKLQYVHV